MELSDLGWKSNFELQYTPARVSFEGKNGYRLVTRDREIPAICTGKLLHGARRIDLPVTGDWVDVQVLEETPARGLIHAVLPRNSLFLRKEAGGVSDPQPIAANIDLVFITVGLDANYSLRRIERYLSMVWESGAQPVVLLTKADLCDCVEARVRDVEAIAPTVHAVSIPAGIGLEAIEAHLTGGTTIALVGSSGVGKSTITNHLLGRDVQQTAGVRKGDSKGRHTTSSRQLFVLPSGGLVIDTPGMRELQLWGSDEGIEETFPDIEELAARCRFADCRHETEPGCAVRRAVDPARLGNYKKMLRELEHLHQRQAVSAAYEEKLRWKGIHKEIKKLKGKW
ncbi:MAG: ribosome small subunit-dependent GTPase A [Armatimonadota bacterium]